MMSLCTQESFDDISLDTAIEELHQELLDAAASIDDSHPSLAPVPSPAETGLFMGIGAFDTIITPTPSLVAPTRIGAGSRVTHADRPVDERRDIYMSHKFADLLPFTSNMYPSLVTDHASPSYWNGDNLGQQVRTHVTPQEVEPLAGNYKTWTQSLASPKPTKGIMEAVIDGGYHSFVTSLLAIPRPPTGPPPPPTQLVPFRVTTSRPDLVQRKAISYPPTERTAQGGNPAAASGANAPTPRSKVTHKKTSSTPKGNQTLTGRFPCPSNCGHVSKSKSDLRRHLQSLAHQAPSFPCPNRCGHFFTREDAAERHARGRRCPKL